MVLLAADENFNNDIVRALQRREPSIDIVRIQDFGLSGADDPTVLEWAAGQQRILLTHDVTTMTRYVNERLADGLPMPGIIVVGRNVAMSQAIEDTLLIAVASENSDWDGRVTYLPLQ